MKKKGIIIVLVLMLMGQIGFADWQTPPNVDLTEKQEIFYQMTPDESMQIRDIEGMTYYPKENAVYLRMGSNEQFNFRTKSDLSQLNNNMIVVTKNGIQSNGAFAFDQAGEVYDFEVDQGKGYQIVREPIPFLKDANGDGVVIGEFAPTASDFEVFGKQFAWVGLPYQPYPGARTEFQFATIPETFENMPEAGPGLQKLASSESDEPSGLKFDRVLPIGTIFPAAFDFSADGTQIVSFGFEKFRNMELNINRQREQLFIELLTIPTESNFSLPDSDLDIGPLLVQRIPEWFRFEVKPEEVEEVAKEEVRKESRLLMVRDMYTTEDHIVVLFHQLSGDSMQRGMEEPGRAFIQRYTYDGSLVDQIETNYRTRRISPGPGGSTLYVQLKFVEGEENAEPEFRDYEPNQVQVEIIQMNWEESPVQSGGMRPVISERTFGGQTLARFTNKGFGLLKQVEEETGIVDYRAPLKAKTNDVRLQIPYCDVQAKAETGARSLMLSYQGQEIAIPFELLLSVGLDEMPCTDDATVEIHLQADEEGQVTFTIELFVVEQVDGMTKRVHRKTIQ